MSQQDFGKNECFFFAQDLFILSFSQLKWSKSLQIHCELVLNLGLIGRLWHPRIVGYEEENAEGNQEDQDCVLGAITLA